MAERTAAQRLRERLAFLEREGRRERHHSGFNPVAQRRVCHLRAPQLADYSSGIELGLYEQPCRLGARLARFARHVDIFADGLANRTAEMPGVIARQ
jgi:hypothetical protein